jgi:ABC-type antimicrobial peptide transport system permease subunit
MAVSDGFAQAIVTFDDGISASEAASRVEAAAPGSVSIYSQPSPPPDVANLSAVRSLPPALAAFLFLLAVAAVGHALATSVRRRRHDLGTVRSLGFLRRQVGQAVVIQSGTLLAIGVVAGTPIGVALGRVVWRVVADGLGVEAAPAVPVVILAALVPAAAVVAVVVATLPARTATRLRTVDALRAE